MIAVILNNIHTMFGFPFISRAILVGSLVSLCAALLGVSLVLKRYAMIGDGLAHVGFGSLSIAVAFGAAPLPISLVVVTGSALLLLNLNNKSKIKSDSAIALIGMSAMALGVAVTSIVTGMNTDVCNMMFGSILALSKSDVYLSVVVSIFVIMLFFVYYRKLFAVTFDEDFAKTSGLNTKWYTTLTSILTALVIVIGMRIMGSMLISAIIVFPAITAMRLFKNFISVVIASAVFGTLAFFIGVYISYVFNMSTGAAIVLVNLSLFILASFIGRIIERK